MRNAKLIIALAAAVGLLLVVAGCGGGGGDESVPADAIATIDGENISKAEFDRAMEQAKRGYEARQSPFPKPGSPEYEQLKNQAVAYLVQRAEFEKEAEDRGIKISDKQIDDRLAQIKKQYFQNDDKKYKAQLKKSGLTEEQVKEDVRAQILSEELFKKVAADVNVAESDIEKFYREHPDQYQVPEQRDIAHILVKKKPLADQLYDQIQNGANFATLAKKYSQDPGSKNSGGKMTISKGQTVAPFDQTAFLMKEGQISHPVKTEFGYHIIKALGPVKAAKTTPLKDVKASIKTQLEQQKKNEKMTKWVEDIRKKYADDVSYQVGYAPPSTETTGATTGN
jgi:parvulin-like peptidyl-prolyl isomerase